MTGAARLSDPVELAGAELERHAPELVEGYRAALPRALDAVGHRLLAAAWREDLGRAREMLRPAQRYGFDRIRLAGPVRTPPRHLLDELGVTSPALAAELTDAYVNLAVGYARRAGIDAALRAEAAAGRAPDTYALAERLPPDRQTALFERLPTEGHNLHPCGRTRLGWRVPDLLGYDQESPGTEVRLVAVRRDLLCGDDLGALLRERYPRLPAAPDGYRLHPVHPWQLANVLPERYPELLATGALRPLPDRLAAAPTTALRTVLAEPDAHGVPHYLKLSLDIQVSSTRRTISVASARNGPAVSALLHRLLAGEDRVLLLPEYAGAALVAPNGRDRDLTAILRGALAGRLVPGEVAIPAPALFAASPVTGRPILAELLDRHPGGALAFLAGYARLLLPPLLRLAARGVGLEAHLQNSIPTFVGGVPHRIAFRDFAGLRLHLPRLARHAAPGWRLWPGSVTGTDDVDVMRAKLGYTALQAHLGELVLWLVEQRGVAEAAGWRAVREVLDESRVDGGDHAFLTAPTVPHKALVRMRLHGDGDVYVPVPNPLHAA